MRRPLGVVALFTVAALVAVACGGSRKDSTPTSAGSGSTTGTAKVIDPSACPAGTDTVGVTGDTITIGTSLPESGLYQAFTAILKGEKSYFEYLNAQGGVEVAGKKYKIKLVDKDDQYDAEQDRHQRAVVDQRRQGVRVVQRRRHEEQPRDSQHRQHAVRARPAHRVGCGAVGQQEVPVDARLGARSVPARDAGVRRLPEGEEARTRPSRCSRRATTSGSRTKSR